MHTDFVRRQNDRWKTSGTPGTDQVRGLPLDGHKAVVMRALLSRFRRDEMEKVYSVLSANVSRTAPGDDTLAPGP